MRTCGILVDLQTLAVGEALHQRGQAFGERDVASGRRRGFAAWSWAESVEVEGVESRGRVMAKGLEVRNRAQDNRPP
jgi:hypothetical protein